MVAILALLVGCSSEQSLREKSPIQWKACDDLFGVENMSSLRKMLGSGDLYFRNAALSVDDLGKELTEEVLNWSPSVENYQFKEYPVCRLAGYSRFSSTVEWSFVELDDLRSPSSRWNQADGDVFVADKSFFGGDLGVVFPCGISGAPKEQEKMIQFEIRVGEVGSPKFSDSFHEKLTVELARSMLDELKCVNQPDIPNGLKVGIIE